MKEQLTDAWARRLETTKDAEVSRAGKAREILHLQAWRGKERERSLLPNARGVCMCMCVCVCVCVYMGLTNTDASLFFLSCHVYCWPRAIRSSRSRESIDMIRTHTLGWGRLRGQSREVNGRYWAHRKNPE